MWLELPHKLFTYSARIIKQHLFLHKSHHLFGVCSKISSKCCFDNTTASYQSSDKDKAPQAMISVWFSLFWSPRCEHHTCISNCFICICYTWSITFKVCQAFSRIVRLRGRVSLSHSTPLFLVPSFPFESITTHTHFPPCHTWILKWTSTNGSKSLSLSCSFIKYIWHPTYYQKCISPT